MGDDRIHEGKRFDEAPPHWSQVVADQSTEQSIYHVGGSGQYVAVENVDSSALRVAEVGELVVATELDQDAIREGCNELGLGDDAVEAIADWYAEQARGTVELELERVKEGSDVVTARDGVVAFTEYHEPEQYQEIVRALNLDVGNGELGQALPLEAMGNGGGSDDDWVTTVQVE
ncbi:hypothetical protein [Natrinema sp. 1APR25-10V2]|uniref:hypothetical protein n=1 Tax=Natrinema sp. 1APR25-10V2 TaxID=2951081 RepID=UPI002873F874|nr:hypothetical protein [Natrinema sp. 1APR25-10V2]MDS0474584.1 hypothetical protein [Natrinema sp. 1APR25-10V2]